MKKLEISIITIFLLLLITFTSGVYISNPNTSENIKEFSKLVVQILIGVLTIFLPLYFLLGQTFFDKYSIRLEYLVKNKRVIFSMIVLVFSLIYNLIFGTVLYEFNSAILIVISVFSFFLSMVVIFLLLTKLYEMFNVKKIFGDLKKQLLEKRNKLIVNILRKKSVDSFHLRYIEEETEITAFLDIIYKCIQINSNNEAVSGIRQFKDLYVDIINTKEFNQEEADLIVQDYITHICSITRRAIDNKNEGITKICIESLISFIHFNEKTIKYNEILLYYLFLEVNDSLIANNMKDSQKYLYKNLIMLGYKYMEKNEENATSIIVSCLGKIFEITKKDEFLRHIHEEIDKFLDKVLEFFSYNIITSERNNMSKLQDTANVIKEIKSDFINKGRDFGVYTKDTIQIVSNVSKTLIDIGYPKHLDEFLKETIEYYAIYYFKQRRGSDLNIELCVDSLIDITKFAKTKDNREGTYMPLDSIKNIAFSICETKDTFWYLYSIFNPLTKLKKELKGKEGKNLYNYVVGDIIDRLIEEYIKRIENNNPYDTKEILELLNRYKEDKEFKTLLLEAIEKQESRLIYPIFRDRADIFINLRKGLNLKPKSK